MIFNSLKLSAFGPFKDEITIDFESLNKAGLFLITGPTGVGKTSIFDAISFALYGEISGFTGVLDKVRSHYAPNTQLTYVELYFTLGDKKCFIRREPSQLKLGKYDKEVMHPHTAFLEYGNEKVIGPNQVSKKISELIGLNADLFRQVVMIPQGEFIKLLNSSSEDKGEIFRQIFNTKVILDFQENIFLMAKTKKEEIEKDVSSIKTRISEIDSKYENIINEEYVNYDVLFDNILLEINGLDSLIKEVKIDYEGLVRFKKEKEQEYHCLLEDNKNITLLDEKEKELCSLKNDEKIEEYKYIVSHYNDALELGKIEKQVKSLDEEIKRISLEIEVSILKDKENRRKSNELDLEEKRLEDEKKEISTLKELNVSLKMELENSSRKEEILSELTLNEEKIKEVFLRIDVLNDDYMKIIDEAETLDTEYEALSSKKNDGLSLYQTKDHLQDELSILNGLKVKYARLLEINELIFSNEKNMDSLREESMQLLADKANIEYQLKINLASELAKSLPENAPCPVCGSLHHPKLATHAESVNDGLLEGIRKKIAETSLVYDNLLKETSGLKKERIMISESLEDDINVKRLKVDSDNIDSLILSYENKIKATVLEIENIKLIEEKIILNRDKKKELDSLDASNKTKTEELNKEKELLSSKIIGDRAKLELVSKARNLDDIKEEIEHHNKTIEDFESRYEGFNQTRIDCLKESYEIVTELNVKNGLLATNNEKKSSLSSDFDLMVKRFTSYDDYQKCLSCDYEFIFNYVRNYDNNLLLLENKIKELTSLTLGKEYKNTLDYESAINDLELRVNEVHSSLVSLENKKETMFNKLERIKMDYAKIELKNKEYETVYRLARIANGYNDSKMPFEKYILSIYFLDILEYANILLQKMSKNRYQLVRRETLAKGNSKQGLDIQVYDYNTGKLRDVKTLSGGESFKASLCLALGLSEVIRRNSSLVPINTLFIDEGFGSLDPESLDIALNLLSSLKDSSRVIGIISHVGELKNRIERQIVLADKNGYSTIEIK